MRLLIEQPDHSLRAIDLVEDARWVIGRDATADIPVEDSRMSRRHVELRWVDDCLAFCDLDSSNGIRVNGRAVKEGTLGGEDVLMAGNTRICLEADRPRASWVLTAFHSRLLERLNLRELSPEKLRSDGFREQVRLLAAGLAREEQPGAHEDEVDGFVLEVLHEVFGLGPLEEWLADDSVSEIMVNAPTEVYIERAGCIERTETAFSSEAAVRRIIDRIVAPLGRRIDESAPLVDARLADGSRVNAVIPPLALKGATLTIRKFRKERILPEQLVEWGCIDEAGLQALRTAVHSHRNLIVSGGTGSGKTTLLNILSSFIPEQERIITIEDAAELQLPQPHVVRLETRPPNLEGRGGVTIRDLLRNALRMRPDRIIVGECRGGEALDMLQAMNTGHDGGMSTVHANTPLDALRRIETLVLFAGMELPHRAVREQVAGAIHVIVQQSRGADGRRFVSSISRVSGLAEEGYLLEPLWEPEASAASSEEAVQL